MLDKLYMQIVRDYKTVGIRQRNYESALVNDSDSLDDMARMAARAQERVIDEITFIVNALGYNYQTVVDELKIYGVDLSTFDVY